MAGLSFSATAGEGALVTFKVLNLETATELAQATLAECRKRGFQVAVTVVDRVGNVQVTLRDRFVGPHTPETAGARHGPRSASVSTPWRWRC